MIYLANGKDNVSGRLSTLDENKMTLSNNSKKKNNQSYIYIQGGVGANVGGQAKNSSSINNVAAYDLSSMSPSKKPYMANKFTNNGSQYSAMRLNTQSNFSGSKYEGMSKSPGTLYQMSSNQSTSNLALSKYADLEPVR